MRNTIILLVKLLIALTSCQKEPDFVEPPTIKTADSSRLLTRLVQDAVTDSFVYHFSYNSAGRLVQYSVTTSDIMETEKIIRDGKGLIKQVVTVVKGLASLQVDSFVTDYFYDLGTLQYTYGRRDLGMRNFNYIDSVAFSYNATGNISSFTYYRRTSSSAYTPANRSENTYVNGNLSTQKAYSYDPTNGGLRLSGTMSYMHDTKVNPLILKEEAVLLRLQGFEGPNNVISESYTDATNAASNYTQTGTYIYNLNNMPVSGSYTGLPAQPAYTHRYYYN
jgi:hypothetical protein